MAEVSEKTELSTIPNTGTWRPGTLDTTSRCFDVMCTGKCQINSANYELKLDVIAADKIPNFFAKNSAGDIVFAEPKPMCTLKMPKGHYGTIIIQLKSVSTEQKEAKDYVCLGVKENGNLTDVLYGDKSYKYIDMTDASKVELVPLISTTKLPQYTKAEVNAKVAFSNTNFDFGAVYRVTIDDNQVLEWSGALTQTSGKRLADIRNNSWFMESNGVGVGPVKNKGIRMLAINNATGGLASSNDGANWDDEGDVLLEGESIGNWNVGTLVAPNEVWITGPVYGNCIWCVISAGGVVRYSTDEAQTWINASQPPRGVTYSLAFGNGMFMTISGDSKKVYASVDANTWEIIGEISYEEQEEEEETRKFRALCYDNDNDRWVCINNGTLVFMSKYGQKIWETISPTGLEKSNSWSCCCYAHNNFYAIEFTKGEIVKSQNGKDWTPIGQAKSFNIGFYNEKLYALCQDGNTYYTGTFKVTE